MPFVPLAAMGTLVFTVINWLRNLTNRNWNAVITQLVAWVAGILVVTLVAHTDYANSISFGAHALDVVNGASLVFLGLIASSILGTFNELKKALDHTDSAVQPPLIPGAPTAVVAPVVVAK